MEIRTIREDDAEAFLKVRKQTLAETPFMLRKPEEFTTTVEELQQMIQRDILSGEDLLLVAEQQGHLVGYLTGGRGPFKKNHHGLYLVIGILLAFTGQGIGTQLFIAAEAWARQKGIKRLDLTVMTTNQAGIALYKKSGFEIEGTKKRSLFVHGSYQDEYLMAKLLF